MLKKIILGLGIIIVILFIVVVTRPADYQVERKVMIAAPAETIFTKINDFHKWSDWSPWEKRDINMKKTYRGPTSGVGSIYEWEGNKEVGKGRMTILESHPHEKVVIKLEFMEPQTATSTTTFSIMPAAGSQTVTWRMEGHHHLIGKAFSLFMSMDKIIGKDFEIGLNNLKTMAEKESN